MTGVAQPARRLAAIMFTDLVGYSALAHRNEKLAIELLELHRQMVREILPQHGGIEIETVGDAFLVEFAGALAAVECAVAIQQRFADHNASAPEARRVRLRIGIHLGDIEHKDGKVMGDGVNVASRIHGVAEPGGICVSESVHQAVRGHGFAFEHLGAPALKNIDTRLQLYALNAAPKRGMARIGATLRRARPVMAAIAAVVVLAAGAAGIWRAGGLEPASDKSVAVLPFANLSSEKDSEYFADGVHDTVLTHLAGVKDLATISRTSVMQYRDPKRNLREIGKALGVAHVVEGSVQRAGNRVRVTAQLIRVADDRHVWAESYDRDVADVFGIQSEIARNVAASVRRQLTPAEEATLARRPTESVAAYDLYLRALKIRHELSGDEEHERQGLKLALQAIAEDPDFALAHALAGHFYNALHWWSGDKAAASQALLAARQSLALQPDLAEGHIALGRFLYWARTDYAGALAELDLARKLAPGNAEVALLKAYIFRRQGRWAEALSQFDQAVLLDPRSAEAVWNQANTLERMGRHADAERVFDRAIALDLWPELSRVDKALNSFLRTGDLSHLAPIEQLGPGDLRDQVIWPVYTSLMFRRDFKAAARVALERRDPFFSEMRQRIPGASFASIACMLGGDMPQAAAQARVAVAYLQSQLDEDGSRALVRLFIAFGLLAQGDRDRALDEARRALEDAGVVPDALFRATFVRYAAGLFAHAGEKDLALQLLGEALAMPFSIHAQEARFDPLLDKLRDDPRFESLIAKHLSVQKAEQAPSRVHTSEALG